MDAPRGVCYNGVAVYFDIFSTLCMSTPQSVQVSLESCPELVFSVWFKSNWPIINYSCFILCRHSWSTAVWINQLCPTWVDWHVATILFTNFNISDHFKASHSPVYMEFMIWSKKNFTEVGFSYYVNYWKLEWVGPPIQMEKVHVWTKESALTRNFNVHIIFQDTCSFL